MRGQYVFIMAKSQSFYVLHFQLLIFGDSPSYFLEMIMLISLKGIFTQTRMGVGRVTLLSKGPMREQYDFLMAKSQIFMFYIQLLVFLETYPKFLETIMLISSVGI